MAGAEYTVADQQMMSAAVNYFDWQARLVRGALGARVLELGCGIGNFTGRLLDREFVAAVDIEPACVERLRERFAGCVNVRAFVTKDLASLAGLDLDSCVCLNVLEHIEDDRAALRRIADALQPGAALTLIVPAFPALFGPIDRNLGHYRRYTRASLTAAAAGSGWRVETMRYMNAAGWFGWLLNARVFRRQTQSEAQIRWFDKWIVPAVSKLESVVPPPFGQSLFAVLRKP